MSDWIDEYFAHVDAMRLDGVIDSLTEDAVFNIGDNPPAQGKDQIGQMIGGFWEKLDGLRHEHHNRFDAGDTTILESTVYYTRKDGKEVGVKTASFLHRNGDLIDRVAFYNNPAPIFA